MTAPKPVDEARLHAYVDGELDETLRAKVEAWLAAHPEDAARVQAYRAQNAGLHELFDPVLSEPLPETLNETLRTRPARRPLPGWMRVAAAIALFAVGGLTGWGLHGLQPGGAAPEAKLASHAVGAHLVYVSEVRHPVEVGADQEAHLVAWLSKRLGQAVRTPHLGKAGYRLIGGRLLPDDGQPAAQFMYENSGGNRLTIYVRTVEDGEDTAFRFVEDRGLSAFYWVDAPLSYALTGKMPREELLTLAHAVYDELAK